MKKILKTVLILSLVLVIPAILAPMIYPWVQNKYPFERVLSRLIMISGVLAAVLLVGRNVLAFRRFGFSGVTHWYRWLFIGLGLGLALIFALEFFETILGAYDLGLRVKLNRVPERIGKALLTGLVVGTVEEFFFRGFIFILLARVMHWKASFILTNLMYALLHFFHGTKTAWVSPNAGDSFQVMLSWITPLGDWQTLLPQMFGLFLFGCILSYAFLKSGGLYLPIGIHAGAVAFLKFDVLFFAAKHDLPEWLYGGKDFYAGIIGWAFLSLFWLSLWLWLKRRPQTSWGLSP
ncbi:MAG: CPBP family intramembrane metalloprotease [Candidatus Omnitrophica bacterium]|nr:CPBP family intramembrane metalloprotease [Candidatus Omnitrophota bacterium]